MLVINVHPSLVLSPLRPFRRLCPLSLLGKGKVTTPQLGKMHYLLLDLKLASRR